MYRPGLVEQNAMLLGRRSCSVRHLSSTYVSAIPSHNLIHINIQISSQGKDKTGWRHKFLVSPGFQEAAVLATATRRRVVLKYRNGFGIVLNSSFKLQFTPCFDTTQVL